MHKMAPTKNAEKTALSCHCISMEGRDRKYVAIPINAMKPTKNKQTFNIIEGLLYEMVSIYPLSPQEISAFSYLSRVEFILFMGPRIENSIVFSNF